MDGAAGERVRREGLRERRWPSAHREMREIGATGRWWPMRSAGGGAAVGLLGQEPRRARWGIGGRRGAAFRRRAIARGRSAASRCAAFKLPDREAPPLPGKGRPGPVGRRATANDRERPILRGQAMSRPISCCGVADRSPPCSPKVARPRSISPSTPPCGSRYRSTASWTSFVIGRRSNRLR